MGICVRKPIRFVTVLAAVIGVLVLAQAPAAERADAAGGQAAATKPRTPPRTSDGHPDLSGLWTNRTATPFERDESLGAKEFYTDEEFANLQERIRRGETVLGRSGGGDQAVYDNTVYGDVRTGDPLASTKRTSLIVGPEGRIPPMLPEAVKLNADRRAAVEGREFDSYEYRNLEDRCILSNLQKVPYTPRRDANTNLQLVQGPGHLVIYQELNHDSRVIPTDGRPHIPQQIRQLQGDSVGRWEGDTLVVETTNFTDRSAWQGSSESLHLVERLTLTGPDTLIYRFTVEDPKTWATPWTAEIPWQRTTEQLYEYACHEGNQAIFLMLGGARKQESDAANAK